MYQRCFVDSLMLAVLFNASKKFTGILLQADVGSLPAPNQRILPNQNLALGPCDTNTISQRCGKCAMKKKENSLFRLFSNAGPF